MARIVLYKAQRGQPLVEVDKATLNGLESYIRWCEDEVPRNIPIYMMQLVYRMALINQGEARKMSYGVHDPSQRQPDQAWRIPVRRISERYYLGWKVKEIRDGYMLYNDSREAYYIEFGINWLGAGRRVRRPIRKLSLRRTMDYMASTQAYHRIWANIYKTRSHHEGFTQIVQSPGMGSFMGPSLGRRLP
jgi:hypothetical protein